MERFVQFVVAGGIALVAGLWTLRLFETSVPSVAGLGLVVLGVAGLAFGIWSEVSY